MAVAEQKSKHYYRDMRSKAEEIVDEEVKTRVLAGLELLQEKHGEGWADKITLEDLDLSNTTFCVLGQVYGGFETGLRELDIDYPSDYGFDSCGGFEYTDLDKAWSHVLSGTEG